MSLGISALYLASTFSAGAFFYTGRRGFSLTTDVLILITLPLHLAYLIALAVYEQKVPLTSFFEALSAIAFFVAFISSILHIALKVKSAAVFSFPFILVFQLFSSLGSRIIYLEENLFRSALFGSHTLSTLLGYSAFAYSMILGLMYLNLFRKLKRKKLWHMFDRFLPLERLERMNDVALVAGFIFLTSGIVLGSILAVKVWGKIPFNDPKILLSGMLWVIYVFGIVVRHVFRWSGRKLSYFGAFGFAAVVLVMVTVRMFLPTLHRF